MRNLVKTASVTMTPGTALTTRARIKGTDGSLLGNITAIAMKIFADDDPETPIAISSLGATSLAVATSTASNTLSVAGGWTKDSTGYNFEHTFDTDTFLKGGKNYRMEYKVTTSDAGVVYLLVNITVRQVSNL